MLQALLVVPGLAARLPARRPEHRARPHQAAADRRPRDGRVGRLVHRVGRADPGLQPPLHRRLAAQLDPRADPRLQRLRPPDRERDRQRRRRWRTGRRRRRQHVGRDRHRPHVQQRDRQSDRLADPGRTAPRGCDPLVRPPGPAHRPHPGRAADLDGLAARHRPRLQLHAGHLPPLLHRRPRSRDRRHGRDRSGRRCGVAARSSSAKAVLAVTLAVTAAWAYVLLDRTPGLHCHGCASSSSSAGWRPRRRSRCRRCPAGSARSWSWSPSRPGLAGPIAYSLDTATTAKTGSIVSAGPGGAFGPGGGPGGGRGFGPGAGRFGPGAQGGQGGTAQGTPPGGFAAPGQGTGQRARPAGPGRDGCGHDGGRGGAGGLLEGSKPGTEIVTLLKRNAGTYTWAAAAVGSNSASGYQLASGEPVMAIGGFNGSDPSPDAGPVPAVRGRGQDPLLPRRRHGAGGFGDGRSMGGSNVSSQIAAWVPRPTRHHRGGTTVYDLTQPATG